MPDFGPRQWRACSAISGGFTCNAGIFIPVYYDLLLNLDAGYHVAIGNWELEDQDDQTITKYEGLNTGGVSFNIGLGYRF